MIPDIYHGDPMSDPEAFYTNSEFVILKATQGTWMIDDQYADRARMAHEHGTPHWAYCFMEPGDPEGQAQFLIDNADGPVGLVLDVEDYQGSRPDPSEVLTAAQYLVARGYKVMIYFMDSEGDDYGWVASDPSIADNAASWIARYGVNDGTLSREPEHGCSLHQYTSAGDMPGIEGACDLSRITGQWATLEWFTGGAAVVPSGYNRDAAIQRGRDIINAWCEYSQEDRWSDDPLKRDCSSFVIDCVRSGGIDLGDGYTGSLYDQLTETGWTAHDFDGNLSDCERGGILLRSRDLHPEGNPPGHTCMVSETGLCIIECGSTPAAEIGIYDDSWDWFLSPPASPIRPASIPRQQTSKPINSAGLKYQAHVQDLGWLPVVHDGMISGTTGYSLRMEAIRFTAIPDGLRFGMKLHIQDIGWVDCGEVHEGDVLGTTDEGKRIECILPYMIESEKVPKFSCHVQDYGWEGSVEYGYSAGSTGESRRIEAWRTWLE